MMKRNQIIHEIERIEEVYCKDCFIKKHFMNTESKTSAHRFCISECTIGEQLQKYGNELLIHRR